MPAAHAWLLLPSVQRWGAPRRAAVVLLGLAGVLAAVLLEAGPGDLGTAAPGWIVRLVGSGDVPLMVAAGVAVLCGAVSQLLAVVLGRAIHSPPDAH